LSKKNEKTNIGAQNNTQKTKDSATRITQEIEDDLCATESSAVLIPLVFQHLFIKRLHIVMPLFRYS